MPYLRYPHLHGDQATFVGADDIWLGSIEGGRATRLSNHSAPARSPRFSPDGSHVAYVTSADGAPEVWVADLASGDNRRLTWWGASTTSVLGWTADGQVLAASNAGQHDPRHLLVRSLDLDGSEVTLDWGSASGVAVRDDGTLALVTVPSRPPAWWKRYRGGTAQQLWLRDDGSEWRRLLSADTASIVDPMWVAGSLLFVSDRAARLPDRAEEQANLWVIDDVFDEEAEPRQLTQHKADRGYVRDASTDGQRVIWHSRGRLWLMRSLDDDPVRLDLTLPGATPQPFLAKPTENLDRIVPDETGDASLVGWRGGAYWLTHREGPARALSVADGERVREPQLLGADNAIVVSDRHGDDELVVLGIRDGAEPRHLATGQLGRVLHLTASADGTQVATISHDGMIRTVRISDGEVLEVGQSHDGEAMNPTFSPDGRYLLWSQPTAPEEGPHQLMIAELENGGVGLPLTSGAVHDHSPGFTDDGKHVVFLSNRTFDPSYDSHEFALSFSGATRPWLIPLSATEPPPFGPSAEGWPISGSGAEPDNNAAGSADGTTKSRPVSPDADIDGAEDRIIAFPVPSADYRDLRAAAGGVMWVKQAGEVGVLGSRRAFVAGDPMADHLEYWSFAQRRVVTVADTVERYAVSGDGRRAVVWAKDEMKVLPATRAADREDKEVVTVDLSRLRRRIDPRAEWRQMFEETARIMTDHFWREDMDGVDWTGASARWSTVVERLGSHDDLVDVLMELHGELNTSHAYVIPDQARVESATKDRGLGLLGADLVRTEGGWQIERILPSQSTDPDARSPLRAAGVDAQPGDLIIAVDGRAVDRELGPARLLVGAADRPVELTLRRGDDDRRVVVLPLASEEALRYQAWVSSRHDYVRERSAGRLGYVHIPDMMSKGWAQLHRDLARAVRAEGLIVDVRYNRGGHTSELVIDRIARRVLAWAYGRHYRTWATYPNNARRGPVVLVANRFSGSDGDIVNAAAQAMRLGPVIGERTWGGVIGIDMRYALVDGTVVTQPRYAMWFEGKGWGVENHGVDPDIEVINAPDHVLDDRDRQLDRAIAELFARLEAEPAAQPPPIPDPKVR
ncbi:MAG: tricorn protease [Acidimicrobiales bacterium]|nr:tricorn protease [Acidimicrobiales bacterium]